MNLSNEERALIKALRTHNIKPAFIVSDALCFVSNHTDSMYAAEKAVSYRRMQTDIRNTYGKKEVSV